MKKARGKNNFYYHNDIVGNIETRQELSNYITTFKYLANDLRTKVVELNTEYCETQSAILYDTLEKNLVEITRNCYDMQDKINLMSKLDSLLNEGNE